VKTAALWCEVLRLPTKDIAALAGKLAKSRLSVGVLKVWRTEEEYRNTYRRVQRDMIVELQKRYLAVREDPAKLGGFSKELLTFGDGIATAVISTRYEREGFDVVVPFPKDQEEQRARWEQLSAIRLPLPVIWARLALCLEWWRNYSTAPRKAMDATGLSPDRTASNIVNGTIRWALHEAKKVFTEAERTGDWATAKAAFDLMQSCVGEIVGPFTA
jgi:hypothetical protein